MEFLESFLNENYQKFIEKTESSYTSKTKSPWITEINRGDRLQTITNINDFWE